MNLDLTLKAVAIVMLACVGYEFLVFDRLSLPIVVVANIFFALSILARKHARRVAMVALGLAFVVPIGTIRSYLEDEADVSTVVLHLAACGYLAYVSLNTFRTEAAELLKRARRSQSEPDDEP